MQIAHNLDTHLSQKMDMVVEAMAMMTAEGIVTAASMREAVHPIMTTQAKENLPLQNTLSRSFAKMMVNFSVLTSTVSGMVD